MKCISVTERLPEICEKNCFGEITFSKMVLTCSEYADGFVWIGVNQYTDDGTWLSEVPFDDPNEKSKVTAWMPLPEPYKETVKYDS